MSSISTGAVADNMSCSHSQTTAGKYSGKLPILFWSHYLEITMMPCQLDCEFKNVLVNSKLQNSLLVLPSKNRIA